MSLATVNDGCQRIRLVAVASNPPTNQTTGLTVHSFALVESLSMTDDDVVSDVPENVWTRPGLSTRDRRFVTLACVCATAGALEPIHEQVYAALANGEISLDELQEFVLQFAVYCGWPKASQAELSVRLQAIRLAEERGEEMSVWPELPLDSLGPADNGERLKEGERCYRDVNLHAPPTADSPYFQAGILAFVFGHVWQRPKLGRRERRLITIACVGVSDAVMPIHAHVGSALESGDITAYEMREVIMQFSAYSGVERGRVLRQAADEALKRISAKREIR